MKRDVDDLTLKRDVDDLTPTRRAVVAAAGAATAGGMVSALFAGGGAARPVQPSETDDVPVTRTSPATYPQSVASGGPTPTGVILWTRIDPAAYEEGTALFVQLDGEGDFATPDLALEIPAARVTPAHDFTVGVDLADRLAPDATYEYRFVYDGVASRVGTARTLPARDASPERLRLAVASCNNYLDGYYGAFAWIAREDVDYLLHLGDFIYEKAAPGTASHPRGDDPEFMRTLYARAIAALTEYLPLRIEYDPEADDLHDSFRLYRSIRYGDLAEVFLTDERFYRSPPPEDAAGQRDVGVPPSRAQDDADRTMLGTDQREWFLNGIVNTDARWKLWANEVLNAALKTVNAGETAFYINYDAWDGYEHERETIMGTLHREDVRNFLTLTGDMHSYVATYLKQDYDDATTSEYVSDERVGVEFMTPAISSDNLASAGRLPPEYTEDAIDELVQSQNPHIEWFNSSRWGYTVLEFTRENCTYTAYGVDRTVDAADAPRTLLRTYRVPAGTYELEKLQDGPSERIDDVVESVDETDRDTDETDGRGDAGRRGESA